MAHPLFLYLYNDMEAATLDNMVIKIHHRYQGFLFYEWRVPMQHYPKRGFGVESELIVAVYPLPD